MLVLSKLHLTDLSAQWETQVKPYFQQQKAKGRHKTNIEHQLERFRKEENKVSRCNTEHAPLPFASGCMTRNSVQIALLRTAVFDCSHARRCRWRRSLQRGASCATNSGGSC